MKKKTLLVIGIIIAATIITIGSYLFDKQYINNVTKQIPQKPCYSAGCSGQLCVDESGKDIVTTCEYKEEYKCYKLTRCERQKDGKCGWTKTKKFNKCWVESRKKP